MMKQTTRLLALSAFVLAVILAAFGVPALEAPNVAFAQVPDAPTLTAQRSGASTINLSWNAVNGAVRYELYAWDADDGWARLDGGEANPLSENIFAHQNLAADRLFFYQVAAVDAQGNRGAWSARANEVAGQNAPGRPALTATPGYQLNTITWPEVPGAASYLLYAWDGSWSQVGSLDTGSFTHSSLNVGQTYYYQARATNANGITGAWSAQVAATVLSSPTISGPQNLQAAMEDQQVTLTWQAPGGTITGYEYRYAESTAALPATWSPAGADLTETVTGLMNGTRYTFEVRAMSSSGVGPPASVMQTPAAVPDAPALTATEGYRLVTLSWEAPANNGAAITAYHIEMLNAQNQWVAIPSSVSGTATSYTIRNLDDSTVYTYHIIAQNAAGRSLASNAADATTLAQPAQRPGPPTGIGTMPGPGSITLSWDAPFTTGGSPITEYQYRYAAAATTAATGISWGQWMSAMTELKVEVMDLTPDTVYSLEVRAVNSAGAGEAANTDSLNTADRTPGDTGPTAVPQNVRTTLRTHAGTDVEDHQSNAEITVSWDEVPESANGGADITGYELCYKESTGSAWIRWIDTEPDLGSISETGVVRTAVHGASGGLLKPGTTYQYRVRAVNTAAPAGTNITDPDATCTHFDGAWTNVVSAPTTPVVKPAAPTLQAFTEWDRNVNSITIRWTVPENTGGAPITGYEVWVGTTMTDVAAITGPTVTNLPPSRTEYISIGLTPSPSAEVLRNYYYSVRARNGIGDNRVGAWSEPVFGATRVTQTGTPGKAATPAIDGSVAADGSVTIMWGATTEQGSTPITSYEVQYQRTDDGGDTPGTVDAADLADWSDDAVIGGTPTPPTALTWTHMQAPGLSTFVYRVRAVNGSGAGAWSENSTSAVVIARGPDAPMLTATAVGDDEIMLQWTIPGNNGTPIQGFAIQQWNPDATWGDNLLPTVSREGAVTINTPTLTVFIVDSLASGTKYYFRIQALVGGDWSTADDTMAGAASATTMAGTPEMPVTAAVPTTGDETDSITVSWLEAPPSGGSDILGYQIRVWDGSAWAMEGSPAADALMYKDEGLAPGTRYYYILAARNSMGYGPWSAAATAMTAAGNPDAPTLTATATGADSIQLTWNVPDANGATITGYDLQIWDPDGGNGGAWGTNLLGAGYTETEFLSTTDGTDALAAGTKYYYRIRALPQLTADRTASDPDAGWSARGTSDAASATTHGDTPGRPTGFTATTVSDSTTTLTLAWTGPIDNGGSAITGYEVQIRSDGQWVTKTTMASSPHTYTGLAAGTRYYYRVRAINSQGGGLWSAYATGTTFAGVPDAPELTATSTGMTTIRLTWTVPDDNGVSDGITGYRLERWDPNVSPANWSATLGPDMNGNLLPASSTVTLFVDSGLDPGKTYYYRILATASANGGSSTIKSATTDPGAPGRPVLTATRDGQNAIDLTWTAAAANGSPIVRYELQVWDRDNSMWMNVRNDLPSTRTSYKHMGLTPGTKYVYRLRGVNRAADNGGLGKWSTIDFADTTE